ARPLEGWVHKVPRRGRPAVGHGEQEGLAPIKREVKSDGKPQVAGAPQSQAEEESDQPGGECPGPGLTGIVEMNGTEDDRQRYSCGPKANRKRERELRVAAHQEFFKESNQKEKHRPEQGELKDSPSAVQGKGSEIKAVQRAHRQQQKRDGSDPPQRS